MARKPRFDAPGLFHHVMARGVDRRPIFCDTSDFEYFKGLACDALKAGLVGIEAYCLMSNHFHLLIESYTGKLSRFMQELNGNFASWFNRKYRRVGHLFQGRFKSRVLASNRAIFEVGRYIHSNPAAAGIVDDPRRYRWSSMAALFSGRHDQILGKRILRIPFSGETGPNDFLSFSTARIDVNLDSMGWPDRSEWYQEDEKAAVFEFAPRDCKIQIREPASVLDAVSVEFGFPVERIVSSWRERHAGTAKAVAAALLFDRSNLTLHDIASRLGYRTVSGVRQAIKRIRQLRATDSRIFRLFENN